jgi:hypothetical protein
VSKTPTPTLKREIAHSGTVRRYRVAQTARSGGDGYERSTKPVHIFRITDRNKTHPYLGYMRPG